LELRHAQLTVLVSVDDHEEGPKVRQLVVINCEVRDVEADTLLEHRGFPVPFDVLYDVD
jgi:hypothetical protein